MYLFMYRVMSRIFVILLVLGLVLAVLAGNEGPTNNINRFVFSYQVDHAMLHLLNDTLDIDIVYSATCLHVTLYIYTYTIKYVTYNIS